jgi:hypothetical protein
VASASALVSSRIPLGAPGVYRLRDYEEPRLDPQRMDVCAFVGVAPRGPAYVPLVDQTWPPGYRMMSDAARPRQRSVAALVKSFDDYRRIFGGFEGPGLLPYAVASFFEQGGVRAYVVRIVPARTDPPKPGQPANLRGLARGMVEDVCQWRSSPNTISRALPFLARNAGTWGDALGIEMGFSTTALRYDMDAAGTALLVDEPRSVRLGTLLLLTGAGGTSSFNFCRGLTELRGAFDAASRWRLLLDHALVDPPLRAEIVEAWIEIRDDRGYVEAFNRLALSPDHPRWLASILCDESGLIWPDSTWAAEELLPVGTSLDALRGRSSPFANGLDDYDALLPDHFFDPSWSQASDEAGSGIAALADIDDVTHLVVPDLYVPANWLSEVDNGATDVAGAEFARCVETTALPSISTAPPTTLTGLILDPRSSSDLARIAQLQSDVVAFCEDTQSLVALIDVPPGLSQGQAERWRGNFDSSWCAAYHPWLAPSRRAFDVTDDGAHALRRIPPSAVAAGIVARKEMRYGVQWGPANEIALEIVDLGETTPPDRADVFHPQGMNCYVRETDGVHLVSARTLSRDPQWRQLSVRRLILMLRRTLLRETQWAVFEPNGAKLWRDLQHAIENLLRRLYRKGAFVGDSEAQAFFVRVHTETALLDRGQLLIDIGVAPAEPLEFILLQLRRDGDGTLTIEE